jgi:hypothetical protein
MRGVQLVLRTRWWRSSRLAMAPDRRRGWSLGLRQGRALITELGASWASYVEVAQGKQIPAGERHDVTAWQQTRDTEIDPLIADLARTTSELGAAESADAARAAAAARTGYHSSRTQSIVLLVVGLLLALGLGLWVAQRIVQSLNRVREVCDGLAAGDLTGTTGLHTSRRRRARSPADDGDGRGQPAAAPGSRPSCAGSTRPCVRSAAIRLGARPDPATVMRFDDEHRDRLAVPSCYGF